MSDTPPFDGADYRLCCPVCGQESSCIPYDYEGSACVYCPCCATHVEVAWLEPPPPPKEPPHVQ